MDACVAVLETGDPKEKTKAAGAALELLKNLNSTASERGIFPPDRPARPQKPLLKPPAGVPRRRLGNAEGRAALLHAVAHIEFNAVDLAFDMAARFHGNIQEAGLASSAFVADWIRVGADEARHFNMVTKRLQHYGVAYGDLPAHDGLWEAAEKTSRSVLARLVVAPMILEARGLDVTPGMIEKLKSVGDHESAAVLSVIYEDEIGHVALGRTWFGAICEAANLDPAATFHTTREKYFAGPLKPPFNHEARGAAGLPREFYDAT